MIYRTLAFLVLFGSGLGLLLGISGARLPTKITPKESLLDLQESAGVVLDDPSRGSVVLILEGQLDPALEYLSRAWAAFPDPEVAAHYGEALWMNGAEEQARIIWQEGLEQDSNHEVLRETIDRLTNGGDTE